MISDNKFAYLLAKQIKEKDQALVVTSSIVSARRLAADLAYYAPGLRILELPENEISSFRYEAKSRSDEALRLSLYCALEAGENVVCIAPKSALDAKLPELKWFRDNSIYLEQGLCADRSELIERLAKLDYERSAKAEAFGQFAVRGDIVDVFGPGMSDPVRIEFFDDEVDSIRSFDAFSQRSIENLSSVKIYEARLFDDYDNSGSVLDYLRNDALIIQNESDLPGILIKTAPVYSGHMDLLESDLRKYLDKGFDIEIVCSTADRQRNLKEFTERSFDSSRIKVCEGELISGVEIPEEKKLFLSENDIFASRKHLRRSKNTKHTPIKAFTDIQPGDYVVHTAHGIGQFTGVIKLTVDGSTRDYLKIQYAGKDVLYVPVDQMDNIQKYMGSDGVAPRVSKFSSAEWQLVKQRAKESIKEMAEEFLKAAAKRQTTPGFAFSEDSSWQKEFEDAFPYAETEDQLRCIEEIKKDMQKPEPMDRLLCGDVGYGKTEVAMRAIFKCLEQGKQVAVLVPTTILANQHYHTFLERFAGYPFAIEMLSRFRTDKEQSKICEKIQKGDIDLVVGTHRLLSSDVKFKDLGLLVVDEEQRFGVEHKELIKRLKENVDVLTLSATPIPRTLHMSLIGVRNMSVIEQPPEDRYPVQTYVMEQDDEVIKDAINRELARGGQVYIVYNRVRGIQSIAKHIKELVPEASIGIGHGQMSEVELEDIMCDFTDGKIQILIATTIIESGLDIPNVNTLIVLDADRFGLSQLYQLRGRVGRSNRMAYAFLFYKKDKQLSEIAEKRLRAIREFTEFGSGFRVAMRDLELRGAGNLLGVEQSGHMLAIGYEMYCRLVEEAVAELTGKAPEEKPFEADTQVEICISAFIEENYIHDELTRLEMYKKIAEISSDEEKDEIVDELLDRFGDIPGATSNLIDIAFIRNLASRCGIAKISKQQQKLVFLFEEKSILDAEKMARLMDQYGPRLTIYGGVEPRISLHIGSGTSSKEALTFVKKLLDIA